MRDSVRADVVVVGGGPAGTSCAISLAKMGQQVVVLERSCYEKVRVGETLPPTVRLLLGRLGVWERFLRAQHTPSPGIISVWGDSEVYENDFIFNPYGFGWNIDRRRFDEMLALVAEELGVAVYRSVNVNACVQERSGDWLIEGKCHGRALSIRAGFLVNATGRQAPPMGCVETKRIFYDRLIGAVKILTVKAEERARDTRTLVEAGEKGWWYSAFLPEDRLIVAYMTDSDQISKGSVNHLKEWEHQLKGVPHTRKRVETCVQHSCLKTVAASSYRRVSIKGVCYLMIGDAAVAFDPLSAQGICKALDAGLAAATAIENYQHGHYEALDDYEDKVVKEYAGYLRTRANYYNQETRWPESVFWKRRQTSEDFSLGGTIG